jgi:predicted transcriptional regulator of viral defense system
MRGKSRTVEQELARIGGRAHGIVTRQEVLDANVSSTAIERLVQKGLLIPQYRGVYRVGHEAPCTEAEYMAAVKASGGTAVVSGRSAGWLLGLIKGPPPPPEVTTRTERRIRGIGTRRCRCLDRRDVTRVRGIPVTSVPRTLVDLAAVLTPDDLARACHEAGVRYRATPRQVEAALKRLPNARGARALRAVMHGEARATLSKLESAFLRVLRREGLPLPETNRPAGGCRVDCRWPEYRLTVELDSYQFHNSRHSWEQDRRRERQARAREDEIRRYTWADVVEDQRQMLRELRAFLTDHPA